MANNEIYKSNPAADLEDILESCLWSRVSHGLWEKGRSRLLVDETGCFYFRWYPPHWVRLYGRPHNLLRHLPDRIIKFDDTYTLDLLSGE